MKEQFSNTIFVLNGPSAGGKSMILDELITRNELNLEKLVTVTTRPPRTTPIQEVNGKDYYFVTREEFLKRRDKDSRDQVVEETEYPKGSGVLYGIFDSEIERIRDLGKDAIAVLDAHGVEEMKRFYGAENVVSIFVYRDVRVIEEALRERELPEEEIQTRLASVRKEYANRKLMDYVVDNHKDKNYLFGLVEDIIKSYK